MKTPAVISTADVLRDVWSKVDVDAALKTTPEERATWQEFARSFVAWLKDNPPSCDPEGDEALAIFHGESTSAKAAKGWNRDLPPEKLEEETR